MYEAKMKLCFFLYKGWSLNFNDLEYFKTGCEEETFNFEFLLNKVVFYNT